MREITGYIEINENKSNTHPNKIKSKYYLGKYLSSQIILIEIINK